MSDDNHILRLVYTFFVGLLLAIFVGVGVSTFYPTPEAPEYTSTPVMKEEDSAEQIKAQQEYDAALSAYDEEQLQPYNRNVSIIVIVAAVILLAVSIVFEKRIKVIADGVMLGGLFSLVYGIGRGFASQNTQYVFVIVAISLAVVLYLGYRRFVVKHETVAKTTKK